jgi:hypothetical protein
MSITVPYGTMRKTSISLSKSELEQLHTVKKELYGDDIAERVPHGQALTDLIDAYQSAE